MIIRGPRLTHGENMLLFNEMIILFKYAITARFKKKKLCCITQNVGGFPETPTTVIFDATLLLRLANMLTLGTNHMISVKTKGQNNWGNSK